MRVLIIIIVLLVPLLFSTIPTGNAMTRVGSLTLNSGETYLQTAVIDTTNGFAYFGTCTSPSRIVKIRLSDFSRVGALTLDTGENCPRAAVIDSANGFAYFGTDTNPGRIVKVRLSDLTRAGSITLNADESFVTSAVIDAVNGFAYFGMGPHIVKIKLSDFTRVGAMTLRGVFTSAVIDTAKGFAYFGTNSNPGVIARIMLSNFTSTATLPLSPIEGVSSAVIDSTNGFAYFGSASQGVLRIRLSNFTRVGYLLLHPGATEYPLRSAIIDTANGFAYFGTAGSPGGIVEMVRLSNFTRAGSLTLNPGESNLYSAVFDQSTDFAYFGTSPGIVVKVGLAPPSVPSPPRNLQATPADSRVTLTWQSPSSDGGSPITHYRIYRGTVSGIESFLAETGTFLGYTDIGLMNGQTYYYQVTAVNALGEGNPSSEASAKPIAPTPPGSPTELKALAGDGQVILGWHQPTSDGGSYITGYRVYRGTISGTLSPITTTIGAVPFYTDSGLTNGVAYFYQMSAVNSVGEGLRSNEATSTPLGSLPEVKLKASDGAAYDIFGQSVSISGNTAVVGAYQGGALGSDSGAAYVFVYDGVKWSQQAKLVASDLARSGTDFGYSVSISGNTILIGAPNADGADPHSGSAYVFVRTGSTWSQQTKLIASDHAPSDQYGFHEFGYSVSVSGDTALVGAYQDADLGLYSGSAYVFVRSGNLWSQQAKLIAGDGAAGDEFGFSVALSGNTAAIGAPSPRLDVNTHLKGSGYVFVRTANVWSQQAKLNPSRESNGDPFGRSLSISGDTVIMTGYNPSGDVYVFGRNGAAWTEQTNLASNDNTGPFVGTSLCISGDTAVVGGSFTGFLSGAFGGALVYVRTGNVWSQQTRLIASDEAPSDRFGSYGVSISGSTIIIGSPFDADLGTSSGSAYVYGSTSGPTTPSAPESLRQSSGDTQVTLSWDVPSFDGGSSITGYRIYRGAISGGESFLIQIGNVLTFADTGLTNGRTYYYKVSAVNNEGEGPLSMESIAEPISPSVSQPVTSGGVTFAVTSNSTISGFQYNPNSHQISFQVSGGIGAGVANMTLPKSIVPSGGSITVTIDRTALTPNISQDASNYYVYIIYPLSTQPILISFAAQSTPENAAPNIFGLAPSVFTSILGAVAAIVSAVLGLAYRGYKSRAKTKSSVDQNASAK